MPDKPTHANWDSPPGNRWALQHIAEILTVAPVARGRGPALPLPTALVDLSGLLVHCVDGSVQTVNDILDRTYTDAYLVIHRERVVCEQYFGEMHGNDAAFLAIRREVDLVHDGGNPHR